NRNVRFARTGGADLAPFRDACFDLVLAVDSMPYLHQSGLADRLVAEARRVLRPRGALVILNLSYRDDPAADRADALRWSDAHAFRLRDCGLAPFTRWDGIAYVFTRLPPIRPAPIG
ncbi:MAG TPA: class I SAM-dependent methyltransferase, partial [Gemmatimonadaceae bacterium]|nr:class I SAM-dependent methyltransferase [Gemmatimonadaceae bacterium]